MKILSIYLALIGFLFGLAAAFYWLKASKVPVKPIWAHGETMDQTLSQAGWISGVLMAISESGKLNRIAAAVLTAIAIVLSTGSSVIGNL